MFAVCNHLSRVPFLGHTAKLLYVVCNNKNHGKNREHGRNNLCRVPPGSAHGTLDMVDDVCLTFNGVKCLPCASTEAHVKQGNFAMCQQEAHGKPVMWRTRDHICRVLPVGTRQFFFVFLLFMPSIYFGVSHIVSYVSYSILMNF